MSVQNDADLIILIRTVISEGLLLRGWAYPVIQRSQATQQGIPTEAGVYFQKLYDDRYGTPGTTTLINTPEVGKNTEVNTQKMESTFQFACLILLKPEMDVMSQPTASDISIYLSTLLQRRDVVRKLLVSNVNVLKVKRVGNEYFEDDRHRHEAWPTFEVIFTWEEVTSYAVDNTDRVVEHIYKVPD